MEQRSRHSKRQPLTRNERLQRQLAKAEGFENYQLQLLENLQSPALAKGGSDALVFFPPGFPITDRLWTYLLRKEEQWNHSDMRSF
ncbi:5083_t:CDS:1, partial [Paraglomus brasilianum]